MPHGPDVSGERGPLLGGTEKATAELVAERIGRRDPWFTASQFAWAERPEMVRLYADRRRFLTAWARRIVVQRGGQASLVDVGCGDGYWLWQLREVKGLRTCGIDYNPVRVARARTLMPDVDVACGDALGGTFSGSYDAVLLNHVLEHVPDHRGMLLRLRRGLKPGGVMIVGVPNEGSRLHRRRWREHRWETDHCHAFTEAMLSAHLIEAGFSILDVFRESFFMVTHEWTYALMLRRWGCILLRWLGKAFPQECTGFFLVARR